MGLRSVSDEVSDDRRQHRRTLPDSLGSSADRHSAGMLAVAEIHSRQNEGSRSNRVKINTLLYPTFMPDIVALRSWPGNAGF